MVKVACLEVESVFRESIAKRNIIILNRLELIPASFQTSVLVSSSSWLMWSNLSLRLGRRDDAEVVTRIYGTMTGLRQSRTRERMFTVDGDLQLKLRRGLKEIWCKGRDLIGWLRSTYNGGKHGQETSESTISALIYDSSSELFGRVHARILARAIAG